MDIKRNRALHRLRVGFPESDDVILDAVIDRREALIRYLAQVHDLTPDEAAETLDLGFAPAGAAPHQVVAAG